MPFKDTLTHIRQKPIEAAALLLSIAALGVSLASYFSEPQRQSDQLTSEVIRSAYADFIDMTDLRAQYPFQSHLFEIPTNYGTVRNRVGSATRESRIKDADRDRLLLEERAISDRLFTMFEQAFYQWRQASDRADKPRQKFLAQVLEYFTDRVLTNQRLLWYWSPCGGNLLENYEKETREYYDTNVKPDPQFPADSVGPFVTAVVGAARKPASRR